MSLYSRNYYCPEIIETTFFGTDESTVAEPAGALLINMNDTLVSLLEMVGAGMIQIRCEGDLEKALADFGIDYCVPFAGIDKENGELLFVCLTTNMKALPAAVDLARRLCCGRQFELDLLYHEAGRLAGLLHRMQSAPNYVPHINGTPIIFRK